MKDILPDFEIYYKSKKLKQFRVLHKINIDQ